LFEVANDRSERFNIAAEQPEVLDAIRCEVGKRRESLVPVKRQYGD